MFVLMLSNGWSNGVSLMIDYWIDKLKGHFFLRVGNFFKTHGFSHIMKTLWLDWKEAQMRNAKSKRSSFNVLSD